MSSAALVPRLALADLWGDRVLAGCGALGLAAVLAPLVVLAGLRAGVIEGLRQLLLEDPHAREIVTASNQDYDTALLGRLAALPHVVFLAPRTRTLAALILLRKMSDPLGNGVRAELIPSALGDPLLPAPPLRNDLIVLSRSAAAALDAHPGDLLSGRLTRISGAERQTAELRLTVGAIAPAVAFARDAAFVTVALAVLVDDYQNGRNAVPADLATLPAAAHGVFAGFRLYADEIESVPAVDAALRRQGIDVVSRASDVADMLSVDHSLGVLFMLVAGLGGAGFLVSLGAGLWAGVERKRVALALLRLVGITGTGLLIFPIVQALAIAAVGAAMAVSAALGMATVINHALPAILAIDRPLCVISPTTAAAAIVCTLAGAFIVAVAAGVRAAGIEPWEGVTAP